MIPVLFSADATDFGSNGIGALSDAISCVVTEERNGEYTLEMEYPVDGQHYGQISNDCIIVAHCGDYRGKQAFQIYKISRPISGRVTISANHISYRLSLIPCSPFTASNVSSALAGFSTHATVASSFVYYTDKTTSAMYVQSVPASIRSRLGGTEGSILDVYGGEYEFDNWRVNLWAARGQNRGVTLRYGKNITDLTQEENIESTITGVYPYWANEDGEYVELPEKVLRAANASNFAYDRIVPLDCSDHWEDKPTVAALRTYATSYLTRAGVGVPVVSITVSFVNLRDTEEYADVAALEAVELCDTLTVQYEKLGVSATAKVVKTVWDVLAERYQSLEVGDAKSNIADTIADVQTTTASLPTMAKVTSALSDAIEEASKSITGVNGGYVVLNRDANGNPYELLIMDKPSVTTATKVWRFNQNGWGYSSTGYGGTYRMAATIDSGIVADYITAGTLTGLTIDNGNGTFHVTPNGAVTASNLTITGGSVAGSTVSGTISGVNVSGGKITSGSATINNGAITGASVSGGSISNSSATALSLANDKFTVTTDGVITSTAGSIGGWTIQPRYLEKYNVTNADDSTAWAAIGAPENPVGTDIAFAISTRDSTSDTWGYPFRVNYDGSLVATKATIKGEITSTSGTIGNWKIGTGSLYRDSADGLRRAIIQAATSDPQAGYLAFAVGKRATASGTWDYSNFRVNYDGTLHCKNADIEGTITSASATITGGSINIETSSDTSDIIKLSHSTNSSNMTAIGFGVRSSTHYASYGSSGMEVYDASNNNILTLNSNYLKLVGSSTAPKIIIGDESGTHAVHGYNYIDIYDSNNKRRASLSFTAGLKFYKADGTTVSKSYPAS